MVHPSLKSSGPRPAIFMDREEVHQADTCEPLSLAAEKGSIDLRMWSRGAYPGLRLPENSLQEICSIGVWDIKRDQDWGLEWHRNEGLEITFLESGRLDFSVDDWKGELRPGHVTVTRPWQKHRVGKPHVGPNRLYWLILDLGVRQPHADWRWPEWLVLAPEELEALSENLRGNEQPVWHGGKVLGECFRKWWPALATDGFFQESRIKILINEMLLSLLEMVRGSKKRLNPNLSTKQRTVQFFLDQLPKHLDFEWDLASMARQCGMARSQFALHCGEIVNRSPIRYLTDCRVEAAQKMLVGHPVLKITEIAERCGFQSSQYFSSQFRKQTGLSPAEFRKRTPG